MPATKRKRELRSIIIVLRGVPGTGKTTMANSLYEMFKEAYDYRVYTINRDSKRLHHCRKYGIDYQASFRDPVFNTHVRDYFFEELFEQLFYVGHRVYAPTVTIIDATNTKIADLKHTLWTIRHAMPADFRNRFDVYVYTKRKEYKSTHDVPECVMERFREELKESDDWLKQNYINYGVKPVNKIAFD